jgi:hypothetical protein
MPRLTKNNSDDAIHPRDKSTGLSCYGTVMKWFLATADQKLEEEIK